MLHEYLMAHGFELNNKYTALLENVKETYLNQDSILSSLLSNIELTLTQVLIGGFC